MNRNKLLTVLGVFTGVILLFLASESLKAQDKGGGLALYTLREAMGENPKETLKKVADAGYAYVEDAGYRDGKFYGMEPAEFKEYLNSLGLKPMSTHQRVSSVEDADQAIADVKAAGFKYFVVPSPPRGFFERNRETGTTKLGGQQKEFVEFLNALGEKCKAAGLELLYHNHDFEYKPSEEDVVLIDYLLENTNPEYVNFQMDLYWVTRAGADPLKYFNEYSGRFKAWHVKDMDSQERFAPVGQGIIDFGKILKQKKEAGMEYYFVEQDRTFDDLEPLEAIKISKEGLKKYGFK